MKDLISIIIPVYNVEKYLIKCLDSISKQSYSNFEVLLIDDGSTDNSGKLCDQYSNKDNRFITIHKENGGVSSARNLALKSIKGDLICFIDPDDYVSSNYLEVLYKNLIYYNCDISMCFRHIFYENNPNGEANLNSNPKVYNTNHIDLLNSLKSSHAVIMKMFKKSLFFNLDFPNLKKGEDSFLMFDILLKKPKIVFDEIEMYYYLERNDGLTKTINKNQLDYIYAYKHWCDKSVEYFGVDSNEYYMCCIKLLDSIFKNLSIVSPMINNDEKKAFINIFKNYYKTIKVKSLKKKLDSHGEILSLSGTSPARQSASNSAGSFSKAPG